MKKEVRQFKMDKNLLLSVMRKQAGTLGKAILELVMNSIDAGSPEVHLTLTKTKLTSKDSGRGFASQEEIDKWFDTFGTPHEEGDAQFGQYRMGRGQIMSHTKNIWRTGHFRMTVDIENRGLEYDFEELKELYDGCHIEGVLYNRLTPSELHAVEAELRELCQYAPAPVYLNGERISVDPASKKWTEVTDEAYILLDRSHRLSVYNQGVLVRSYSSHDFGTGGLVVSRQKTDVNFARNDIMSTCPVWRRIKASIRKHVDTGDKDKNVKKDATYRGSKAKELLASTQVTSEDISAPIFTDIEGKHRSVQFLMSAMSNILPWTVVPRESENAYGELIHRQKLGLVLSSQVTLRFGHYDVEQMLSALRRSAERAPEQHENKTLLKFCDRFVPFEELKKLVSVPTHTVVPDKELTSREKTVLRALKRVNFWGLNRAFTAAGCETIKPRAYRMGVSKSAKGWTDGKTYIAINRTELAMAGHNWLAAVMALAYLIAHEYLHDSESLGSNHIHDADFYEAYHNIVSSHDFSEFVQDLFFAIVKQHERDKIPLATSGMRALDGLDSAGIDGPVNPEIEEVV